MSAMLKSHPAFSPVTDRALVMRDTPKLGKYVFAFAPRTVHKAGEPFPTIERNLIQAVVFHVGPPEKGWEGLGHSVDLIPTRETLDRLDSYERELYARRGYITRTMLGWFESVEQAARRERYIDAK